MNSKAPHITADDALSIAAAKLKRASGPLWAEFEKAFETRTFDIVNACVQAPADKLSVTQGRAQECVKLSTLFSEAIETADKLNTKLAAQQK